MDFGAHLLKHFFLFCNSLFLPVYTCYSLISSARRHLTFFPLHFSLSLHSCSCVFFILCCSFWLLALFRFTKQQQKWRKKEFVYRVNSVGCCMAVAKFNVKILTCFVSIRWFHFSVLFCTLFRFGNTVRLCVRAGTHGHTASSVLFHTYVCNVYTYIGTLVVGMQMDASFIHYNVYSVHCTIHTLATKKTKPNTGDESSLNNVHLIILI